MSDGLCEVKWIRSLLEFLQAPQNVAISFFTDATQLASNSVFHQRTKHVEFDCHSVHDAVHDGLILPVHISTQDQPADILTKPLARAQFELLSVKLGIVNLHTPT